MKTIEKTQMDIDFEQMCEKHFTGFSGPNNNSKQQIDAKEALKNWMVKYSGKYDRTTLATRIKDECETIVTTNSICDAFKNPNVKGVAITFKAI